MDKSPETKNVIGALIKAQAEMPKNIAFDSKNPYYNSQYASLGAVINAVGPVLARHGLNVLQLPASESFAVGLASVIIHESGEWISSKILVPIQASGNVAQEAGKAITYLRRYSLSAICGVYSDEDNDGNEPVKKQSTEESHADNGFDSAAEDYSRPLSPDVLKAFIHKKASTMKYPASEKQVNFAGSLMAQTIQPPEVLAKVKEYLFGVASLKEADGKLVASAMKWLDPQNVEGKWQPCDNAIAEMALLQTAVIEARV